MNKSAYHRIEAHMLGLMSDSAHDPQHIYRVLYFSLDIAQGTGADMDVLIAAALLHDIGRAAEYADHSADHAAIGAEMAYRFLVSDGWDEIKAAHVRGCISTHRYRSGIQPASLEAKILFDADKLDAVGITGIARTMMYKALVGQPLYAVDDSGMVCDGEGSRKKSVFQEYHWKLKGLYGKFHTPKAGEMARERRQAAVDCYERLYGEVSTIHEKGAGLLDRALSQ